MTDQEKLAQYNWCLEFITKIPRKPDQVLTPDDQKILDSGEYTLPDGTVTTFTLPINLRHGPGFQL